jgi:dihydroxy-acid dehydratase
VTPPNKFGGVKPGASPMKASESKKPLVGIAVARTASFANAPVMEGLLQSIQQGIETSGGQAVRFSFEEIQGSAEEHATNYWLPRRDLLADEVECISLGAGVDGLVLVGTHPETLAGFLMGAARTELSAVLASAGFAKEAMAPRANGSRPWEEAAAALTFALVMEALGVSPPGMAALAADSPERFERAFQAGGRAVEMVRQNLPLKKVLSANAFANAVRLDAALGGTADVILHLLAIAQECGVSLSYDAIEKIHRQTPQLADLRASGAEAFEKAGGVPATLAALKNKLLPAMTVNGKNIMELVKNSGVKDPKVIHVKSPLRKASGLAMLSGNLAPGGAVANIAALPPARLAVAGPVKVFDSEESCVAAIKNRQIKKGTILVIRYEGPAGGPGMRPLGKVPMILEAMGLAETVPLITDGRFAGAPKGLFISMVSPEAAAGGPIALLKSDDQVEINVPNRQLIVRLTDTDLKVRRVRWKAPAPKAPGGYLSRYSRLVTGAHLGAVVKS